MKYLKIGYSKNYLFCIERTDWVEYGIRNRQEVAQAEQKPAQARYKFMLAYLRLVKESGLGLETVFAE
ncbi:Uncharacterised protein [Kingella denitrificans]|uniref:Uncharacterized protein n=1 Tax=Kingella denitrificans ATCC 33394 TaxID=888741 RepID=F0EWV4_9NEIS|nr:hypothetical protein [Kingella denitrificans]EGC18185.1 hypothetical protein HMPREF9098_0334 [Kingella denitrificans ATCC 33394]QQB41126.1 hypothetical protein I6I17_06230 [Kingella denitrificans]STR13087.1 Uncharacterised protein [Kingella denitrificans]